MPSRMALSASIVILAKFNSPTATAVDISGNVYVADYFNHRIRMITPAGNVTTLAGTGTPGFQDGPGASAQFNYPIGVAVDRAKNVYVADSKNNRIRVITPAGVVSTLAGTGIVGNTNGAGAVAQFNGPCGVALDGNRNIYVADTYNNLFRRITPAGVVSTVAGDGNFGNVDGPAATAEFSYPDYLAVDGPGNIYLTDRITNRIRKINRSNGAVSTIAGTGEAGIVDGGAAIARFHSPTGITVDAAGNVYITDLLNNRIRKLSTDGIVTTLTGHGDGFTPGGFADGPPDVAVFNQPQGLSVDAAGNLYLADFSNHRIRKINPAGDVTTLAGTGDPGFADGRSFATQLASPMGLVMDLSGNVIVADYGNHRIRKITPAGIATTVAGSDMGRVGRGDGSAADALFGYPSGVAINPSGYIYVADGSNNNIRQVIPDGIIPGGVVSSIGTLGTPGFIDGVAWLVQFNGPAGIAADASGNFYVADTYNNVIRKIDPFAVTTTFAGNGTSGYVDGPGLSAEFNRPSALTVDNLGNIWVADTWNNRIRKITPAGVVSTFAGNGVFGFLNGTGTAAEFSLPYGITVDRARNLYIADYGNNVIRKITPAAVVTTYAGDGIQGWNDGPATSAEFALPIGLCVDGNGNVYVGDMYNNMVRKITPAGIVSTLAGDGIKGL
ncbi:MAG TPA: NHL repeat-containing protein [Puia sp.]|nr:NHL repeat-containing protein [Puia sp.]